MSRQTKISVKEVKRSKIVLALCTAAVILVLAIFAVIKMLPVKKDINAGFMSLTAAEMQNAEKSLTINPMPYYDVKINVDGQTHSVLATGTVGDAVEAAGISVDDDDLINVGMNEPLNYMTDITINRVDIVEEVRFETIEYATEYKEDDNYVIGYTEVVVDGEDGEIEKTLRHVYVDGRLSSSKVVKTEVTEPVDEVVVMGTSEVNPIEEMSISQLEVPDYLALDENGVPTSYTQVLTGKACAYSAKPTAKTASGRQVKVGYVAVDPSIIPYGTELYIASTDNKHIYGYAIAADTGTGLLEGYCLVDLFMESYEASCEWGAKQVNIYVLK